MSDRELLEAAAKAAGLEWGSEPPIGQRYEVGMSWFEPAGLLTVNGFDRDGPLYKQWNPLTDDGDALRLAVKLRFIVSADTFLKSSFAAYDDTAPPGMADVEEPWGTDPYAATRRCIVRAAAALGEKQ